MSGIFAVALAAHVLIGLIGVMASYATLMGLLRREPPLLFLRFSALTAFLSYLLSWVSGGYYYVLRYGIEVKPVILVGAYPWAHTVIMESKEHIFLFLPVLAFTVLLVLWRQGDRIASDQGLKRALIYLAALTAFLGIFIAIAGVVISGAAK